MSPVAGPVKRVVHKDGRHGVVLDVKWEEDGAKEFWLVHWGSVAYRDVTAAKDVTRMITDWVPLEDLALCEEPVFVHGDRGTKQTVMVYDPEEHRGAGAV